MTKLNELNLFFSVEYTAMMLIVEQYPLLASSGYQRRCNVIE